MVSFKWLGQACFEIKNSTTIVTDPHNGEGVGLKPPKANADIVTVSHGHFDHAAGVELVKNKDAEVVKEYRGKKKAKDIDIEGIDSYHDKSKGSKRGENTIYRFKVDEVKICHLGDLGHTLSEEKQSEIKPVDVLMIPVGGNYTIDGEEALEIAESLEAKVVIPMHYKIPGLTVDISSDDEFLQKAIKKGYKIRKENTLDLENLPKKMEIVKLEYQEN